MSILIKNIGDSLDDLGYTNLNELENYLANLNFVNYSKLIHWLSESLNKLSSIESIVNEIDNEQEVDSFKIELSGLLKELGSPYSIDNIDDLTVKLTILNYLCGELLASSIVFIQTVNQTDDNEFNETEIAKQLRLILMSLGISKPPPDVKIEQIFNKITESIDVEFKRKNITIENSLLFNNIRNGQINPKLWSKLDELNQALKQDYELRKRTLITRSDCTIASFKWKKDDRNEELDKKIDDFYHKFNYLLERDISINIAELMAFKPTDFNQINNTVISKSHQLCTILPPKNSRLANQGLQQKLSLHKFLIGSVPDRGGRVEEAIKPQQESFAQQQAQRQQQNFKNNNRNFQNNKAQNFNMNPNRVQGSGWNNSQGSNWNQNYQDRRNFSGQSGKFDFFQNINFLSSSFSNN